MEGLDFEKLTDRISRMSCTAQATFLFKLTSKLGPAVLRSNIKYCGMNLDRINSQLPAEHPNRVRYEKRQEEKQTLPVFETIFNGDEKL